MPHYFKRPPLEKQRLVFDMSVDKPYWAKFMERGTGKTYLYINKLAAWRRDGYIDAAVITAGKGEYKNPRGEFAKDWPDDLGITIRCWGDKDIYDLFKDDGTFKVLLINIESLQFGGGDFYYEFVKRNKFKVANINDECTNIKNVKSKRTNEAYTLRTYANFAMIGTGSPVTESPLDLWGQCNILKKGILGHTSFTAYRARYCELEKTFVNRGGKMISFDTVVGYQNLEELRKTLVPFSSILTKKDCFDLPPKIFQRLDIEMTKEQAKIYHDMKNTCIAELESLETVTADNVLAQFQKLNQIVAGQVKLDGDRYASVKNNNISTVLELLDAGFQEKVIIWCNYRQVCKDLYEAVAAAYGKEITGHYAGFTTDDQRDYYKARMENPEDPFKYIICSRAAARGNTWITATANIYVSNGPSNEDRLQSEDRSHRYGQDKSVLYIDFVTPGTVSEQRYNSLQSKKELADYFLQRPEGWRELFS